MVQRLEKSVPHVNGIYQDLYGNKLWVASLATWLQDSLLKSEVSVTPGQMLAMTTAGIVFTRYQENAMKNKKEEPKDKPEQPPATPPPPPSRQSRNNNNNKPPAPVEKDAIDKIASSIVQGYNQTSNFDDIQILQ